MKVVVLDPGKVLLAGLVSALVVAASVLGVLALAGFFRSEPAQAYQWPADGGSGVGARYWYFAEGYTGPGFEEWICLYNPAQGGSGGMASVQVKIFGSNGYLGDTLPLLIHPGRRATVNINEAAAGHGYSGDVAVEVYSDRPIVAERAMYFDYKGKWSGGCSTLGYQEAQTGR